MRLKVTITVPDPLLLSANRRMHWASKASRTRQLRTLGRLHANRLPKIPPSLRARVDVYVHKGTARRYDPANFADTIKPIVDGIVDAGLLMDDDYKHVDGPHMHHGGVQPSLKGHKPHPAKVRFDIIITTIGGAL